MILAQTVWRCCDHLSLVFFSDDAPAAGQEDIEEAVMDCFGGFGTQIRNKILSGRVL